MITAFYINQFQKNLDLFKVLLNTEDQAFIHWKQNDEAWSLLEIICHLRDEEVEDFRQRLNFVLGDHEGLPPGINPPAWVKERAYLEQDYQNVKASFLEERQASIRWIESLNNPDLDRYYIHPSLGKLDGHHFLNNWLAHDYLHIRQITRLRYDYLHHISNVNLDYAGTWK